MLLAAFGFLPRPNPVAASRRLSFTAHTFKPGPAPDVFHIGTKLSPQVLHPTMEYRPISTLPSRIFPPSLPVSARRPQRFAQSPLRRNAFSHQPFIAFHRPEPGRRTIRRNKKIQGDENSSPVSLNRRCALPSFSRKTERGAASQALRPHWKQFSLDRRKDCRGSRYIVRT